MIQTKLKPCAGCNQLRHIWKSHGKLKYCKDCWYKQTPPKSIPKVTPNKRVQLDEYSKKRVAFLALHPSCQGKLVGCTKVSTEVHHKAGRVGDNFLNMSTWLAVCRSCHTWIENHPEDAKELELSVSRLNHQEHGLL
jgi:hypothetical protein